MSRLYIGAPNASSKGAIYSCNKPTDNDIACPELKFNGYPTPTMYSSLGSSISISRVTKLGVICAPKDSSSWKGICWIFETGLGWVSSSSSLARLDVGQCHMIIYAHIYTYMSRCWIRL